MALRRSKAPKPGERPVWNGPTAEDFPENWAGNVAVGSAALELALTPQQEYQLAILRAFQQGEELLAEAERADEEARAAAVRMTTSSASALARARAAHAEARRKMRAMSEGKI